MFGFGKKNPDPAAVVEAIERRFPLPDAELARLKARRWIFEKLPKGGVGAEIGVFRGHFSAMICEHLAPQRLYLVDPWRLCGEHFGWGKAYTNDNTLTTQAAFDQTAARVAQFPAVQSVMIEGFYPACDAQIPEPLDFAYLDASHKFDETLAELHCLQSRIKPGGIIFGDDWRPDPKAAHHAVYRAVQEFVRHTGWEVMVAGPAGQWAIRRVADRQPKPQPRPAQTPQERMMQFNDIPGWFNPIDQAAFTWILQHQNRTETLGHLVELGVFKGKSAVLMGNHIRQGETFYACDLFDDITTSDAADEGEKRFFKTQSLTQAEFERNYLAFHPALPQIVRGPTSTITSHVAPGSARFVHIDAGHTYDLVREDTASTRAMLRETGVVVFDDYRKANTMGTGAAVMEAILNEGLRPILNTEFKLYATWGDPAPMQAEIAARALAAGWCKTEGPVMIRNLPMLYLGRKG